jgi:predicted negative regulator of RcsB-dependent stress response
MMKENRYPEGAKIKEFVALTRASALVHEKKLDDARQLLRANLNDKSEFYKQVVEMLIYVDGQIIDKGSEAEIRAELAELTKILYERTGDPLYYYKLGQINLRMGNKAEARKYFVMAYESAPADAFYRLPAKTLAEKLQK